jgi:hypothetical protein
MIHLLMSLGAADYPLGGDYALRVIDGHFRRSYPKPTKYRRGLILLSCYARRQTTYPSALRIALKIFCTSSSSRGIPVT